jgi:hypothetical protein
MSKYLFDNQFVEHIQQLFEKNYEYYGSLEDLHEILETSLISEEDKEYHKQIHDWNQDRNSIFIKQFHKYVDETPEFEQTYKSFLTNYVKPLFPLEEKIVVQKTPNIRFHFPDSAAIGRDPKDPENIIGLHCDSNFGHNENEMNFIIPLTSMYDTNSIYYETEQDSNIDPQQFENLILKRNVFFQVYFNKLRHCNKINITNKTRISFDIRVIPYSKYMENIETLSQTKFALGNYYVVLE